MAAKITKRSEDFSQWYQDIVQYAKLADYSPVKGCMVIRPNGYAIWEKVQSTLDKMFKDTGHVNAYFPLFIPESFLKKEKEHVEGFAPQCAVVTHGGGVKLEEPLIVRPTSETIINAMYSKWISSYRDLPILINQWANVVRWEMRTRLFLRTTEFLWQEGHTAHETDAQAMEESLAMLAIYKKFAEEYMAMPVIDGEKSESERFAGAIKTFTIEAMMQDKKALQAGTSHHLGQNFAKAFDIKFQGRDGKLEYVHQTSWGVSTRLIGALIMVHGDDKGIIIPPKLATTPVVAIPIFKDSEIKGKIVKELTKLKESLKNDTNTSINMYIDDREQYSPGWKFNEWELQGIPLRIEMGPKDLEKSQCVLVRRDTGEKKEMPLDSVRAEIPKYLDSIQKSLYDRAKKFLTDNTHNADDYEELKKVINNDLGFASSHWCEDKKCEEKIKEETKATIRCIPLDAKSESGKCIICNNNSTKRVIFAKAY